MTSDPTRQPAPAPWRLLILDRGDPDGPVWMIATVDPADVRPATGESTAEVEAVAVWVGSRTGAAARLTPLPGALAWRLSP